MGIQGAIKDIREPGVDSLDISVNATETIYTHSFKLDFAEFFGLAIQATSAGGTPDLLVQLEMSPVAPTTEGASDSNFVIPDGFADIYTSLADEVNHVVSISPPPMRYGRLVYTGNGPNPADTTVRAYLFLQVHE